MDLFKKKTSEKTGEVIQLPKTIPEIQDWLPEFKKKLVEHREKMEEKWDIFIDQVKILHLRTLVSRPEQERKEVEMVYGELKSQKGFYDYKQAFYYYSQPPEGMSQLAAVLTVQKDALTSTNIRNGLKNALNGVASEELQDKVFSYVSGLLMNAQSLIAATRKNSLLEARVFVAAFDTYNKDRKTVENYENILKEQSSKLTASAQTAIRASP